MSISTDTTAIKFLDVSEGVPLNCDFPLFSTSEAELFYGNVGASAEIGTDFIVTLNGPDFADFTVTPTATLIAKIDALIVADPTEVNRVTIRRFVDYTTTVEPETVRLTPFLSKEIDRIHMKLQQLAEGVNRAVVLPPSEVGEAAVRYYIDVPEDAKTVVWDESIGRFVPGPSVTDITNAETFAAEALASKNAAAASAVTAADEAQRAEDAAASVDLPELGVAGTFLQSNGTTLVYNKLGVGNIDDAAKATEAEARAGTDNTKIMTPLRVRQSAEFPLGFVLQTTVAANPATYLGYGTWVAIEGVFIVGAGTTFPAGSTGGSDEITIGQSNLPNIDLPIPSNNGGGASSGVIVQGGSQTGTVNVPLGGSGTPVNTLPPYTARYMWERTA